jgi:hypothetical protein
VPTLSVRATRLRFDEGYALLMCSFDEVSIEGGQGNSVSLREFKISRVVHGEFMSSAQVEECLLVTIMIETNRQIGCARS